MGPPRPPVTPMSTLVMQNRGPLVISKESQPGNFVFQRDSAGLGVPRGSLGELKGIANGVEHHGSVNRPVYAEPMGPAGTEANPTHHVPMALRQGAPPESGNWPNRHADAANTAASQPHAGAAINQGPYHGAGNGSGGGAGNGPGGGGTGAGPRGMGTQRVDPSTTAPGSAPEAGPRAPRQR